MSHRAFAAWLGAIAGVALLQSFAHLVVVLRADRIDTFLDLDRSNGLPDIVSTLALGLAAAGAFRIARRTVGRERRVTGVLAVVLAVLTLADLVHDGPHPASGLGWITIVLVVSAALLLAVVAI